MLTAFIIWFTGVLVTLFLTEGFWEKDIEDGQAANWGRNWRFSTGNIIISLLSWVSVVLGLWSILTRPGIYWKFPTGKHYVELQKPILSVLLFLSGFGTVMLVHGVNTHCILMNLSMVIIVLISFFAALHPIKSQKDFFWAVFAMLFPMILDKVLHCLI